jgi:DNA polymerase-3 subunit delta
VSLADLEAGLKSGPARAYVFTGEAGPLVERARAAVESAVLPQLGPTAFNHGRYRATDPGAASAFTAARTLPMMAALRLVELRDVQEAPPELWEALLEYLKDPSPTTVLVLVGAGFPKVERGGANWALKVRAALKAAGGVAMAFGADAIAPERFAAEVAQRLGKSLSASDAQRLVEAVGADLGRIEQEVQKLALYVGDGDRIDGEAITACTALLAEAVIWDLTAGLATRDADLALTALYRLQSAGDDARKLLGMILWQMRELLRASELVARGVSDREVVAQVRLRWDLMRKVRPVLERGFPDAGELLRRLATANRHMNSHRAGESRVLEGLVLEMLDGRIRRPPPVPRPR